MAEPIWSKRLLPEDCRGLTPLIYGHVNPYGRFDLERVEQARPAVRIAADADHQRMAQAVELPPLDHALDIRIGPCSSYSAAG